MGWIPGFSSINGSSLRRGDNTAKDIAEKVVVEQAYVAANRTGYSYFGYTNTDVLTVQRVVAARVPERVKFYRDDGVTKEDKQFVPVYSMNPIDKGKI